MSSRILDTIKRDHREIEACYDRIVKSTDPDEQTRFQNQFTWELARHSVGEELVLYPALEKHLPEGHELAEKDRNESQAVRTKSIGRKKKRLRLSPFIRWSADQTTPPDLPGHVLLRPAVPAHDPRADGQPIAAPKVRRNQRSDEARQRALLAGERPAGAVVRAHEDVRPNALAPGGAEQAAFRDGGLAADGAD